MRKFLDYVVTLIKVDKHIKSGWAPLFPPPYVEWRSLFQIYQYFTKDNLALSKIIFSENFSESVAFKIELFPVNVWWLSKKVGQLISQAGI